MTKMHLSENEQQIVRFLAKHYDEKGQIVAYSEFPHFDELGKKVHPTEAYLMGASPHTPGIFEAWLGCPKGVEMVGTLVYSVCLVKRSQALRGRNLTRDNQVEGALKVYQASGVDCTPEAVFMPPSDTRAMPRKSCGAAAF